MRTWEQYLRGYVEVYLTGLSPERFFNLCGNAGLSIWNVVSDKPGISFCMALSSFFQCRPYARKAGVTLRIRKKKGLPFWVRKNRCRLMWLMGGAGFLGLLFALSFFIWDIEYQGNFTYTENQLEHSLERMGIWRGIRKSLISCEALEAALREEYEGMTWVSARVSGTRLFIQIKENEVPKERLRELEEPCDLRANADAQIVSVVVRNGIPVVKAGDHVQKGDLLVSGRIPITDDSGTEVSAHQVHADAEVIGRRERIFRKTVSCWHEQETATGKKRYGAAVKCGPFHFCWLFPNIWETEWRTITRYEQAEWLPNFALPLYLGQIVSEEISVSHAFYTEEELLKLAEDYQAGVMENLMEKGVHIIENNVKILVNGSVCRVTVTLQTEEPIQFMSQQGEEQINEHN